ncbi:MAG: hypothetical protein WDZ59_04590 [Pirellulales bacterium]
MRLIARPAAWTRLTLFTGAGLLLGVAALWTFIDPVSQAQDQPPATQRAIPQATQQAPREELPQPLVNTHDLMALYNRPLFMMLKAEMQNPQMQEDHWATIADRGMQAAELTNLIVIREEAQQNREVWVPLIGGLRQAGLRLVEAAKAQNQEQVIAAYRNLVTSCNQCHRTVAPQKAPMLTP